MVYESVSMFLGKLACFHGYVNEFNGYPKPLDHETEEKLLEQLAKGDKHAREELINHNVRLVAHIAKKYSGAAEADELISVGSIGLIKGIDSFNKERGSQLSTYVSRCIENEILMLLRASKKHKGCVSIEEIICVDKDGGELSLGDIIPQTENKDPANIVERSVMIEEIIDFMKKNFDERAYSIMSLRFGIPNGIEHTQKEVSEILGISRSYISRIEKKALEDIRAQFLERKSEFIT